MKAIPEALTAHLQSGVTSLCCCWRLSRRDGVTMGFTDHDRLLQFDGTEFEAAAGFTASEVRESIGLSIDNLDVSGAISSGRLEEADLEAGLYDDAKVEIFRVNWADPTQRVLMRLGSLGEVKRAGNAFSAEVRGLAHYLGQPKGRLFQYTCDTDLGSSRCGVDLEAPAHRGSAVVATVISLRRFTVTGLSAFANDWFTRGLVRFTSGAANGQAVEVRLHRSEGAAALLELWQPARAPLTIGQTLTVTAGCDKHLATCQAKFSNAANFQGFPHMPGNDFLTTVVRPGASR